jgi:N-methylhydantoinase B
VIRDVLDLTVSPSAAADIYAVVITAGTVDEKATAELREQRRRERIGQEPKPFLTSKEPGREVGDSLLVREDGETACARCGTPLGSSGPVGARTQAVMLESSLDPAGPHRGQAYGDLGFRLRRYACPGCGIQFHAELAYEGDRLVSPPDTEAETVPYVRRSAESGQ